MIDWGWLLVIQGGFTYGRGKLIFRGVNPPMGAGEEDFLEVSGR
jgi:hypothetical protein